MLRLLCMSLVALFGFMTLPAAAALDFETISFDSIDVSSGLIVLAQADDQDPDDGTGNDGRPPADPPNDQDDPSGPVDQDDPNAPPADTNDQDDPNADPVNDQDEPDDPVDNGTWNDGRN